MPGVAGDDAVAIDPPEISPAVEANAKSPPKPFPPPPPPPEP